MLTIEEALLKLQNGEVIVIPTETVYGLAASISDDNAVKKIFELKKRPFYNPLIIHIGKIEDLNKVAKNILDKAWKLVNVFFPGSLTLVLEKKDHISDLITSGGNKVAIRMPNHPITLELINKLGTPIAAPSANPFNYLSPTSAEHVKKSIPELKHSILDGGECTFGIESTIVGFTKDHDVKLLRYGAIPTEEIESILHEKLIVDNYQKYSDNNHLSSPGMLCKHYSPKSRLILCDDFYDLIAFHYKKKIGILSFSETIYSPFIQQQIILSKTGNLFEATKNFFSALYLLDSLSLDLILAKKFPNSGLGTSLNDRLLRASASMK